MFIIHPISATSRCSFYCQLSSIGDFCKCHLQKLEILFANSIFLQTDCKRNCKQSQV